MSTTPTSPGAAWHLPPEALHRYAQQPGSLPPAVAASVEAHLDGCTTCRSRLVPTPDDADLLHRVGAVLAERVDRTPQYPRPRRHRMGLLAGLPLTWLVAVLAVIASATAMDLVSRSVHGGRPSLLLLVSPIVPLLAVVVAWAPRLDPMQELTASTPAAGLSTVLRRSLVALAVAVLGACLPPLVEVAVPPARWLIPGLALTAVSLALGSVIPLHRAAGGVAATWAVVVVLPGLAAWSSPHAEVPAALRASALPAWAAVGLLACTVVVARRAAYRRAVRPARPPR